MAPKYVHAVIPTTISTDMEKGTLQMWLSLRILRCGVYPDYPGSPSVITWDLKKGKRKTEEEVRETWCEMVYHCWLCRWAKGPQAKECRCPVEAGKSPQLRARKKMVLGHTTVRKCIPSQRPWERVQSASTMALVWWDVPDFGLTELWVQIKLRFWQFVRAAAEKYKLWADLVTFS